MDRLNETLSFSFQLYFNLHLLEFVASERVGFKERIHFHPDSEADFTHPKSDRK